MNSSTIASFRPSGTRVALGLFSVFAAVSMAAQAATEAVTMKLGGRSFGPGVNMNAVSGTKSIAKSKFYTYKISGTIRGKSGQLAEAFPSEIPLASFLDSLKAGSSDVLEGTFANPTGNLPVILKSYSHDGARNIRGLGRVALKLKFVASIDAQGKLVLKVSNVKVTLDGKPMTGAIVFGKGSTLEVTTAPIVEFKAKGQAAFLEGTEATVTVWRLGNKDKAASVQFTTVDGTAMAGVDYATTNGSIDFAPGEVEKTITVTLLSDSIDTTNSKFTIVLSNPATGTVLGSKLVNTVSITNVD